MDTGEVRSSRGGSMQFFMSVHRNSPPARCVTMHDPVDTLVNERPILPKPASFLTRKLVGHRGVNAEDGRWLDTILQRNQRSVEPGSALVELGAPHSEIHVIVGGWAMRRKKMRDGSNQIVALHLPGEICEFNAVLGMVSDTETVAIDRVRAAAISARTLNELSTHPRLGRALWWESMASGAIQRQWFANVASANAATRMAHLLCELEQRLHLVGGSQAHGEGRVFTCPLTQMHLGNATAMSVEHANRTLAQLRRQFGLRAKGGLIEIDDLAGLQAFCGFDPGYIVLDAKSHAPSIMHGVAR
ncbi:Crp/Fnr family transcriptional regulator [Novosphingobium sp. P6W]|uniref:Crp/Fnr family transcriptional regulator n=1 Tax=Novosphingobium sp. P6W TaxID=1609758 RepID=UPI0009E3B180|nr:Crp/Fnr family transcriptional regulator [Novosphingobium sp. P6W]AXB75547.1 Crp/Fnr family transcriptional regulator [Novosphingobium sp. P6W]